MKGLFHFIDLNQKADGYLYYFYGRSIVIINIVYTLGPDLYPI